MAETVRIVKVRDLEPGDILTGSKFIVDGKPFIQLVYGMNKRVVPGRYPNGRRELHVWNADTTMGVIRDEVDIPQNP